MNGPTLQVQMLGQFTLRYGDRTISDSDDRSRRVWSLLAYMLYNHGRSFAQEELIHLYWSNGEKSADPGNALKSIFHRIRTALDKLQPGLGRLLIRRKAGRYFWNNTMPLSLDIEDFEAHFHAAEAAGDDDVRLAEYQAALQDTNTQLTNAKAEMETPFAKEAELAEKSARLKELNILLNMDQRDNSLLDEGPEGPYDKYPEQGKSKDFER